MDECRVRGETLAFWRILELLLYVWVWLRSLTSRLSYGSRNRRKPIEADGLKGTNHVPLRGKNALTCETAAVTSPCDKPQAVAPELPFPGRVSAAGRDMGALAGESVVGFLPCGFGSSWVALSHRAGEEELAASQGRKGSNPACK